MQTLVLVSHTHWDREWYLTFEEYRTRLVAVYDELLDVLETDPAFHSFAFDGQTVPVDDYLEIRPEAIDRLRAQVRARRLHVGPQYIIPDGYAPTGETWVRNFLLGVERCADLGGEPGYVYMAEPTALPEQLPQIVRRFGWTELVLGRGISIDQRDGTPNLPAESEFFWEGADGSRVLTVHMPAAYDDARGARCILHYCNSAEVFWGPEYDPLREQSRTITADTPEGAIERIRILRDKLTPIATSDAILLMHGCDHLPPQRDTAELIRAVNARIEPDGACIVHGSFADYLATVRAAGKVHIVRRGESRGRGGALSRVALRRIHQDTMVRLERWMEPASAMAWFLPTPAGRPAMSGGNDLPWRDEPGLRKQAWRYAIQNLAHDTIWGACIDAVYDEFRVRAAKSRQIAEEIASGALREIGREIDTARVPHDEGARAYVAFSSAGHAASEVVETEVWLPPDAEGNALSVTDSAGRRWPAQVLDAHAALRRTDRHARTARVEPVRAVRALVRTAPIPPLGYAAVAVAATDEVAPSDLATGETWVENAVVRVDVHPDGSFDLTDKRTGRVVRRCNRLVDQGDAGNGWRWNRVECDRLISPPPSGIFALVERGPVRATIEVVIPWRLPEGLTPDKKTRLRKTHICPLTVRISLLAGSPRVEVRTALDNRVRNHRLRAHVPTGVRADVTQADGAFAVHERPVYLTKDTRPPDRRTGIGYRPTWPEESGNTWSWVDASDGHEGLAVLTRGLPAYEVLREDDGTILFAVTLMRAAVGHTTIHDPDLTHGAQMPGEQEAEYALYPHAGDWLAGGVRQEADGYVSPPRLVPASWHGGSRPPVAGLLAPLPPEIALTMTKRSEDGRALVLRFVNLSREPRDVDLRLAVRSASVGRVDLREETGEQVSVAADGTIRVPFAPMEIVTLRVERADARMP